MTPLRDGRAVLTGLLAVGLALSTCTAGGVPDEGQPALLAPGFSVRGGIYTSNLTLRLAAPAGVVHYTLDGTDPVGTSPEFQSPIPITNSLLVRARAFGTSPSHSPSVSESYTVLGDDLREFTSNLPLVIIDTHGQEFSEERDAKWLAAVRVVNTNGGRASLLGPADFQGRMLLNVRGHSSRRYPKHSFTLRPLDENDDKRNVALLGMSKESEWVLHAPYPDKTLMRDVLAYELSNRMGRWAPRTRFVEVFIHHDSGTLTLASYAGVYVLEDKVTRDKQRVDIARLQPGDDQEPAIAGGYIFKKDHFGRGQLTRVHNDRSHALKGNPGAPRIELPSGRGGFPSDPAEFLTEDRATKPGKEEARRAARARKLDPLAEPVALTTNFIGRPWPGEAEESRRENGLGEGEVFPDEDGFWTGVAGNFFFYVEPEPDELTALQRVWLKDYVDQFERALYGPDWRDPVKGYAAYIDPDSFIDHHLFVEATKNVDGYRFSTYYHKDRGGRLRMGPIWDWNLSWGNCSSRGGYLPEHWLWPQLDDNQYSWFRRLFTDPDFGQRYVDRWTQLRAGVLATSNILGRVDALAALLDEAQKRNFTRWPILGQAVTPNYFVGTNYTEEVAWMKSWIEQRLGWLDKQFLPPPTMARRSGELESATAVAGAKIFFTVNGSDPRAPGGEPSPQASSQDTPVALRDGTRAFARVRLQERWSGPLRIEPPAR